VKLLLAVPALVVLAIAVAHSTPLSPPPAVSCDSAAMFTEPPKPSAGERVLFGRVAVPPGYMAQVVSVSGDWHYWRKAGLLVRAGTKRVSVTVPEPWRNRVAITWGDSGTVAALRIELCNRPPYKWNAYAGGFYFRKAACVPLVVRVGARSTTIRFGVGVRCPSQ